MKVEHVVKALSSIATNLYNHSDKLESPDHVSFLRTNGGYLRDVVKRLKDGYKLDCNHVIVTRYTKKDGKEIVHTYGPYTRAEAIGRRKKMLEEHDDVKISVHKMIDVDGENLFHEIRGWH